MFLSLSVNRNHQPISKTKCIKCEFIYIFLKTSGTACKGLHKFCSLPKHTVDWFAPQHQNCHNNDHESPLRMVVMFAALCEIIVMPVIWMLWGPGDTCQDMTNDMMVSFSMVVFKLVIENSIFYERCVMHVVTNALRFAYTCVQCWI